MCDHVRHSLNIEIVALIHGEHHTENTAHDLVRHGDVASFGGRQGDLLVVCQRIDVRASRNCQRVVAWIIDRIDRSIDINNRSVQSLRQLQCLAIGVDHIIGRTIDQTRNGRSTRHGTVNKHRSIGNQVIDGTQYVVDRRNRPLNRRACGSADNGHGKRVGSRVDRLDADHARQERCHRCAVAANETTSTLCQKCDLGTGPNISRFNACLSSGGGARGGQQSTADGEAQFRLGE